MKPPNTYRARQIALNALGPDSDDVLAKLDAAGLVLVLRRELPRETGYTEKLLDVQLTAASNRQHGDEVTVTTETDVLAGLAVAAGVDVQIREALHLQAVMGHRIDVVVDREGGMILDATAVER